MHSFWQSQASPARDRALAPPGRTAEAPNFCILTAPWEGKSWSFRLRKITDRSHVDGPASTTNNSLCAWLAIVSARSRGSPRQKTPTQSRSQKRLTATLQEVQRKRMARDYGKNIREKVVPEPETERQKTADALGDPKSSLRYLNL